MLFEVSSDGAQPHATWTAQKPIRLRAPAAAHASGTHDNSSVDIAEHHKVFDMCTFAAGVDAVEFHSLTSFALDARATSAQPLRTAAGHASLGGGAEPETPRPRPMAPPAPHEMPTSPAGVSMPFRYAPVAWIGAVKA